MIDSMKKRLQALLNEYVPEDIAMKGINSISPQIGKFLKKGLSQGLPIAGGLEFLRNQLSGNEPLPQNPNQRPDERALSRMQQQSANQTANVKGAGKAALGLIGGAGATALGQTLMGDEENQKKLPLSQRNRKMEPLSPLPKAQNQEQSVKQPSPLDQLTASYPDVMEYINKEIQKGRTPQQAAALARTITGLSKKVQKIEKESGENFVDMITALFGPQQKQSAQPPPQQQNAPQQQKGAGREALINAINNIMKM